VNKGQEEELGNMKSLAEKLAGHGGVILAGIEHAYGEEKCDEFIRIVMTKDGAALSDLPECLQHKLLDFAGIGVAFSEIEHLKQSDIDDQISDRAGDN